MRPMTVLLAAMLLTACSASSEAPVVLSDVEITPPRPGANMSAGYLTIANNGAEPVSVDRVTSPQFGKIELHETTTVDGVSRMRPIEAIDIPPGETVTLERGGKHLMLMRPADELGDVSLSFFSGEELLVSIETVITAE